MYDNFYLSGSDIYTIKEWEKKGGIGVHHTDVAKTINDLKRLGFK